MSAAFARMASRLLFEGQRVLRPGEAAVIARAVDRLHGEPGWAVPTSLAVLVELRWDEHLARARSAEAAAAPREATRCPECGAVLPDDVVAPVAVECAGGDHVLIYDDGGRRVVGPGAWVDGDGDA